MFEALTKQLESFSMDKIDSTFKITKSEFETFCKQFLFEQIKGEIRLGEFFCKKYGTANYVLSTLSNRLAKHHIEQFYVK